MALGTTATTQLHTLGVAIKSLILYLFTYLSFFAVQELGLRALDYLSHAPSPFCLFVFQIGSLTFFFQAALDYYPTICTSLLAGNGCESPHPHFYWLR
jgi:hypothetical protein